MATPIDKLNKLCLGIQGESKVNTIMIDVSTWLQEYPTATINLLVTRPNESILPYVAVTSIQNGILSWVVTASDTQIAGSGQCELRATQGDKIKKSVVFGTIINPCLTGTISPTPPAPYATWVQQILDAKDAVELATTKYPYIGENYHWYVWNILQEAFVDTGVNARGSSNYNDLENKPKINNVVLQGNILSSNLGLTKSDVGLSNVDNTSDMNKPVSTAQQTAITNVDNKLNESVEIESDEDAFSYSGDTVTFSREYKNLKTGETESKSETVELANTTTAGLMSPSDYNAIISNTERIAALEGQTIRLLYTTKDNPTAQEIQAFVIAQGYTDQTKWASIGVVVRGTNHIWKCFSTTEGGVTTYEWTDVGVDTVEQFTNNKAGIIKGSSVDGQVFAESDGTGSVYGWSNLKNRVTSAENNLTDEISNRQAADTALDNAKQNKIDANNKLPAAYVSGLANVATSGSYDDLSNKPTIPSKTSDLQNDSGFIDKNANDLTNYTKTSDLAAVATSGNYNDLSNKPNIPTVNNSTITIKQGGVSKGSFTTNSANDVEINLDEGGGGSGDVQTVDCNGLTIGYDATTTSAQTLVTTLKALDKTKPTILHNLCLKPNWNIGAVDYTVASAQARIYYSNGNYYEDIRVFNFQNYSITIGTISGFAGDFSSYVGTTIQQNNEDTVWTVNLGSTKPSTTETGTITWASSGGTQTGTMTVMQVGYDRDFFVSASVTLFDKLASGDIYLETTINESTDYISIYTSGSNLVYQIHDTSSDNKTRIDMSKFTFEVESKQSTSGLGRKLAGLLINANKTKPIELYDFRMLSTSNTANNICVLNANGGGTSTSTGATFEGSIVWNNTLYRLSIIADSVNSPYLTYYVLPIDLRVNYGGLSVGQNGGEERTHTGTTAEKVIARIRNAFDLGSQYVTDTNIVFPITLYNFKLDSSSNTRNNTAILYGRFTTERISGVLYIVYKGYINGLDRKIIIKFNISSTTPYNTLIDSYTDAILSNADWAENDKAKSSYVENRIGYWQEGDLLSHNGEFESTGRLAVNERVWAIIDGKQYNCEVLLDGEGYHISGINNLGIDIDGQDEGFGYCTYWVVTYTDTTAKHYISLSSYLNTSENVSKNVETRCPALDRLANISLGDYYKVRYNNTDYVVQCTWLSVAEHLRNYYLKTDDFSIRLYVNDETETEEAYITSYDTDGRILVDFVNRLSAVKINEGLIPIVANGNGTATRTLTKLQVGNKIYEVPSIPSVTGNLNKVLSVGSSGAMWRFPITGTNDGTNWTSLSIYGATGMQTYNIPQGGGGGTQRYLHTIRIANTTSGLDAVLCLITTESSAYSSPNQIWSMIQAGNLFSISGMVQYTNSVIGLVDAGGNLGCLYYEHGSLAMIRGQSYTDTVTEL